MWVLALSLLMAVAANLLRQPVIIGFVVVGVLVGPFWLDLVHSKEETWDLLSTLGISLLLFLVGLKLDVAVIKETGGVALAVGLGEVVFTSVLGLGIALALGLSLVPAIYVAVALTFSSTIIIVKLLTDKREIDSLHGRVSIGLLIVQDIVVIVVMIGLSTLVGQDASSNVMRDLLMVVGKGAGLLAAVALLMRFVLSRVFNTLAMPVETILLGAIAWAAGLALIAQELGFSREIGAFIAGVAVASTPAKDLLASRLVSIRDFLLLFFFLTLGASLEVSLIGRQIGPAIVLSLFVLIGNPLIVMTIMRFMRYSKRTGFLTGLTVAQISEFSLLLGALGVQVGHITGDTLGLITLVGLITIGASTYIIVYSHQIYVRLAPFLDIFNGAQGGAESSSGLAQESQRYSAIVFGMEAYGLAIAKGLQDRGDRILCVDFNPASVKEAGLAGMSVRWGEADDADFIRTLPLGITLWVVSTIPLGSTNLRLMQLARDSGFEGRFAFFARDEQTVQAYRRANVDLLLEPYRDAALMAVQEILRELPNEPNTHSDPSMD